MTNDGKTKGTDAAETTEAAASAEGDRQINVRQKRAGARLGGEGVEHGTVADPAEEALTSDLYSLDADMDRCCRYHARRRAFYDLLHKTMMSVVLIGSSSAIAEVHDHTIVAIGAASAGIAGIMDLVMDYSLRARDHEMLYRRFNELHRAIVSSVGPSIENLREWRNKRLEIEADEPPVYRALDVSCHNEVVVARGTPEQSYVLGRTQILLMHFWRFSGSHFVSRPKSGVPA